MEEVFLRGFYPRGCDGGWGVYGELSYRPAFGLNTNGAIRLVHGER